MKIQKLISLFFFLLSINSYAQNQSEIFGKILFEEDSLAIYNAHIVIKGTNYGTTSNEEGAFYLNLRNKNLNDTFIISYLGCEYFTMPISKAIKKKEIQIYLASKTNILDEIIITTIDAKKIMKKAIENMANNYSQEKNIYNIHFKEIKKQDTLFVSYLEVAADLVSKGFDNKFIGAKNYTNVYLKGKRTSFNYDPEYQDGNGLFVTFWLNWARGLLSKKALKNYSFDYEGLTNYQNEEVYKISASKLRGNDETYFYISKDNYAILAIDYHLDNSKQDKPRKNQNFWFLAIKLHVDFYRKDGICYINAIDDYRKSKNSEGTSFEWIRNIRVLDIKKSNKLIEKHKISPETNLFEYPIAFEADFWKSYNAPLESETEKKIKIDLEKNGVNIKKQFDN